MGERRDTLWHKLTDKFWATFWLLFAMFPIFWMLITTFKTEADAWGISFNFTPTLNSYITIMGHGYYAPRLFLNTLMIACGVVLVAIPLALFASYVLSRYPFKGSNVLILYMLATQFIPPIVIIIPYHRVYTLTNMIDTKIGMVIILLSAALPYSVWLIKGYIDSLPNEIEEAAQIDGCNHMQVLWRIIFPLVLPGIISTAVFCFIMSWNDYLFALIMTRERAKTLMMSLANTNTERGVNWPLMSAVGMYVMIPMMAMAFAVRKYFVQGMTMGGIK